MKSNSCIFGVKSITNLIYGLIILLPMFSILGRVIYTQSNLNAKDSYYGETINKVIVDSVSYTQLKVGEVYNYQTSANIPYQLQSEFSFNVTNFSRAFPTMSATNQLKVNRVVIKSQNNATYVFFYQNNTYVSDTNLGTSLVDFTFTFKDSISGTLDDYYSYFTHTSYVDYSYLDNAFEYSLHTFTKENNLGNVDMFGWFTDMFLSSNNVKNNLYVGFVNWYLNYAMLVSSGYLLFLVLIWFINYVRKIMDKSMYHDFGGF